MSPSSKPDRSIIAVTIALGGMAVAGLAGGCQSLSGLSDLEDAAGGSTSTGAAGGTGASSSGGSGADGGDGANGGAGAGGSGAAGNAGGMGGEAACPDTKTIPIPACSSAGCAGACMNGFCDVPCGGAGSSPVCMQPVLVCNKPMTNPTQACRFICDMPDGCDDKTIACPAGEACEVVCIDAEACTNTTVNCSDGPCELKCESADACNSVTLNCGAGSCHVQCAGPSPNLTANQGSSCSFEVASACDLP